MKTIKVIFANNDYLTTRINGTKEEIITHYQENNFFNWCSENIKDKNVKEIQFLDGFEIDKPAGCRKLTSSYIFFDYQNNGLLQ